MADQSVRSGDIFNRPVELIDPDPDNCRDIDSEVARADIEEIALSILKRGFDVDRALLVRKVGARWIVTDGHKRRRAVLRAIELGASIKLVPCRSEAQGTDEETRALLRLRAPGRELTPLEAVIDIKRLLGWNWTKEAIAEKLGKKTDWIDRCLELAGAPLVVRDAVKAGLAPTVGRSIARIARTTGADAGELVTKVNDHAVARGKTRATTQDFDAVVKPRTEPVSINSLAIAAVLAWEASGDPDRGATMAALRDHIGAATLDAMRVKLAA